eukprot:CAMPEP_0181225568 /NCGR_PEP_ID=MMETSP1096-20121128/31774_1 /TAXON_ID=156174 ORGANISM="Chrysochromulina ericina, Strain CCMP281" /NCGR_SAMPLE_ID=MMETSP1096 /ASSEMBLY_ACC=CAM_ASM_000453 /LENGTH=109 /DNA_ID=CAMNT_0023318815 /DNA_START=599 /DNA_END=929 /DNA_ORIENTATION=-
MRGKTLGFTWLLGLMGPLCERTVDVKAAQQAQRRRLDRGPSAADSVIEIVRKFSFLQHLQHGHRHVLTNGQVVVRPSGCSQPSDPFTDADDAPKMVHTLRQAHAHMRPV